jgi:microcystin degradation protein MlrC
MRVGIIGLMHESNTCIAKPTTLEDFRREILVTGDGVRRRFAGGHHEVSGFLERLERERIEAVPLFMAWCTPSGPVAADALDELVAMILAELERAEAAGGLDGLLVAPHGAGVSERHRDMDGHWLTAVRERFGRERPIVCTLDAHANVSPRMLGACDATIVYRSNPHLDQKQRGLEAAALMARTLRGEVRPVQAGAFPGVAINIERQLTAAPPCRPWYDLADRQRQQRGVLSNSLVLGFPYADVEEMGSGAIVVTDGDRALAERLAGELAGHLVAHREEFRGQYLSVDEAVAEAVRGPGPVCLLDMGDNVGGGSPGDGTLQAHAHERRGSAGASGGGGAFVSH